jgi:pimeloyl-ACP methyl ester carboxylesterase
MKLMLIALLFGMKTSLSAKETMPVNEMQMYYEIHGQGEPLVLLHGFTGSGANWKLIFKDSYDDMNFTPPYLSTITARTLIVYGDRDPLYPINILMEMHTAIPGSYLWMIPPCSVPAVVG